MANLIPQTAKKSVLVEYWTRVVSVWLILWSVALIAGAGVLLPAYVLITERVDIFKESAVAASEKVTTYESASVALEEASKQAKVIIDESKIVTFSEHISLFEELQGLGIQISQIKLSRIEKDIAPVILNGTASDRNIFVGFRDRLRESEYIESVDFPISNLAKDKDIKFTMTVVMNNNVDL
mgnify:CR=1 FL=1